MQRAKRLLVVCMICVLAAISISLVACTHDHKFDKWDHDDTYHWKVCSVEGCTQKDDSTKAKHELNANGKCECGYEKAPSSSHEHTYEDGKWVDLGNGKHAKRCDNNDYTDNATAEDHTFVEGKCSKCDAEESVTSHTHTYTEGKWADLENGKHAKQCDDGDYIDNATAEDHTFVEGKCSKCDAEEPVTSHTHTYEENKWADLENGKHAKQCDDEDYIDNATAEDHTFVEGKCSKCDADEPHTHTYEDDKWVDLEDGTCAPQCDDEDYIDEANADEHEFVDGKCERCDADEPHTHTYTENKWVDQGNGKHARQCDDEDYVDNSTATDHTFATGSLECESCDYEHVHNFADGELTDVGDNTNHAKKCADENCPTNAFDNDKTTHNFVATPNEDGETHSYVCEDCDYVKVLNNEETTEAHDTEFVAYEADSDHDVAGHHEVCSTCGYVDHESDEAHSADTYVDDEDGNHYQECDKCEEQFNMGAHDDNGWNAERSDDTKHYHYCETCGLAWGGEEHVPAVPLKYEQYNDTYHATKCGTCEKTYPYEKHDIPEGEAYDYTPCSKCSYTRKQKEKYNVNATSNCWAFDVSGNGYAVRVSADSRYYPFEGGDVVIPARATGNNGERDVTVIKANAFNSQTGHPVSSIVIPKSVTSVEQNAFASMTLSGKFLTVYYQGTKEEWSRLNINANGNDILKNAIVYFYSDIPTDACAWHWSNETETDATAVVYGYHDVDGGAAVKQGDVVNHWILCSKCSNPSNYAEHTEDADNHPFNDNTTHQVVCEACEYNYRNDKHTVGRYEDNQDGATHKIYCEVCEQVYNDSEKHTFAGGEECTKCEAAKPAEEATGLCKYVHVYEDTDSDGYADTCKNCGESRPTLGLESEQEEFWNTNSDTYISVYQGKINLGSSAAIKAYVAENDALILPAKWEGITLTEVGAYVKAGDGYTINKLVVPSTITSISYGLFYDGVKAIYFEHADNSSFTVHQTKNDAYYSSSTPKYYYNQDPATATEEQWRWVGDQPKAWTQEDIDAAKALAETVGLCADGHKYTASGAHGDYKDYCETCKTYRPTVDLESDQAELWDSDDSEGMFYIGKGSIAPKPSTGADAIKAYAAENPVFIIPAVWKDSSANILHTLGAGLNIGNGYTVEALVIPYTIKTINFNAVRSGIKTVYCEHASESDYKLSSRTGNDALIGNATVYYYSEEQQEGCWRWVNENGKTVPKVWEA